LLTTDGTVTTALATLVDEPVAVRILDQHADVLAHDDDELALAAGESVLERRVLLHGARSGAPLLYGASRIVLHRLPAGAREALRSGDGAIGMVLRAHRLETFRVPLCVGLRAACAGAVAQLGSGLMCRRRYAINASGQALMIVDEQFPADGFEASR
jgi:chorismate-pyruvate lyase